MYRNKSAGGYVKHPPDTTGVILNKLKNELFIDGFDYQIYHLMENWAWYSYNVDRQLGKMTKKTAFQVKSRTLNIKIPDSTISILNTSRHRAMHVISRIVRPCDYSNTIFLVQSNPSSRFTLCYETKQPKHMKDA